MKTYLRGVLGTMWALPPFAVLLVYTLALRVRVREGTWPWLGHPKPVPFAVHDIVATIVFIMAIESYGLAPLLIPGLFRAGQLRRWVAAGAAVFAVEWLLLTWLFHIDPGGVFVWLLD